MESWVLMQGESELGRLIECEMDQPFTHCKFAATDHFALVRHLFDEELALLNQDRMDEWFVAYEKIDDSRLRLVSADTKTTIDDFLLHVEGDEAWFRY